MSEMPAREVLEATHRFPGRFLFKVIGRTEDEFAARVVAVVREVLSHDFDPPHELRHTSGGRHVAVSIEPWLETLEQALLVYARIRELPGLVMMM
jgi:putative lipoic acid-binding regulatory protein